MTEVSTDQHVRARERGAGIQFVLTAGLSKTFRSIPGESLISPPSRSRAVVPRRIPGIPDRVKELVGVVARFPSRPESRRFTISWP